MNAWPAPWISESGFRSPGSLRSFHLRVSFWAYSWRRKNRFRTWPALLYLSILLPCPGWAQTATPASSYECANCALTNAFEVHRLSLLRQNALVALRLEGTVLWVPPTRDQLLLQTEAGCIPVETDLRNQMPLPPGQRVLLEGTAVAGEGKLREALVDNDGLHPPLEDVKAIELPAGRLPVEVSWFNGPAGFALTVDYAPPGQARRHIPNSALYRANPEAGKATQWMQGLEYRCYEGNWERLPRFEQLPVIRSGTTTNFELGVRTRDQQVGLVFSGYLEVPRPGRYTFWLHSDDGSQLRIGGTALRVARTGTAALPTPRVVRLREELEDCQWTDVEGVLTSVRPCPSGGAEAELSLGTNRLYMELADASGEAPELFSPVRARGVCRITRGSGGRAAASRLLVESWKEVATLASPVNPAGRPVRRIAELRRLGTYEEGTVCALRLQGLVLAASPAGSWLVLQDQSGAALVQANLHGRPVRAGNTVALEGVASVQGSQVRLREPAVVENDRVHQLNERTGRILLSAGKHPLHLSWFNRDAPGALEVEYQGPGLARQPLPAEALLHAEPELEYGASRWAPGLAYCCYDGPWVRLPDPGLLLPSREGLAANFDMNLASGPTNVALEFNGFLEVPREGLYQFWVRSDDGSRLYIGETRSRVEVTGSRPVPSPVQIVPSQLLGEEQQGQWSQVEGTVTFASEQSDGLALSLRSGTGPMRVLVADPTGGAPRLLLESQVRLTGLPQLTYTSDGQQVAGGFLTPSCRQIELLHVAAERWAEYPVTPLGQLLATNPPRQPELVHVRGTLRAVAPGEALAVEQGQDRVWLETTQSAPLSNGMEVEALGRLEWTGNRAVLRNGCYRELVRQAQAGSNALPLLTTIEQVKSLSREEAGHSYPVHIRGILTAPLVGGFFIQDAEAAIYVSWEEGTNTTLHAGDYWEVEGQTFAEFAPNIDARRAVRLGAGTLPAPLRPTWDQLINGSLDTRYVEIQGIVSAVEGDSLALLTRSGKIHVEMPEATPDSLRANENALIRVRGCLMPGRNENTQEVEVGRIRLLNSSLTVDEPAPADPFTATPKRAADLLLFDPRAGAIQRVKITGQVMHARRGEYFLLQGSSGVRFEAKAPVDLRPGDLAEVVGFPVLGGPAPVLREAVARRIGHVALPPALPLAEGDLLNQQHEANLVRVRARLVNLSIDHTEQVLEMQAGTRGFVARLEARKGLSQEWRPGSQLELTGVYAGQGGDVASGRGVDAFELLLNSAADVRVLARPSWWSLRHTLAVLGAMALVLLVAVVWIWLLRREVEERSGQLAVAIRRQEHAETQRRLEEDRARVARDLHDDLGAALTEIGLLGGLAQRVSTAPERAREHLGHITNKAREMVTTLDEIVWSLNPRHDSVASLSKYFCEYAQQFLQLTPVRCRLEVAEHLPESPLSSEQRHHLLLAFKEALTNVVRHAQAGEAHIGITVENGSLVVTVADDGRGLDGRARSNGADGLDNLASRLKQLGGTCDVSSRPGHGTRVRMSLPVNNPTALGSGQP